MSEPTAFELMSEIAEEYRGCESARGVLCVAEEAGEFVAAYRRWAGLARRSGTREELEAEIADVVIAAWSAGTGLGIDMEAAVRRKAVTVLDRIAVGER